MRVFNIAMDGEVLHDGLMENGLEKWMETEV
jgi:hypothetical protein